MRIDFIRVNGKEIRQHFPEFYAPNKLFFEINQGFEPMGIYGIKTVIDSVCEISVYIYEECRRRITKGLALGCLKFPFSLGFEKVLISTELKKMQRFLSKLSKQGVRYVIEHNGTYWYEIGEP